MEQFEITSKDIVDVYGARFKAEGLILIPSSWKVMVRSQEGDAITTFVMEGAHLLPKVGGWLEGWISARSFKSLGVSNSLGVSSESNTLGVSKKRMKKRKSLNIKLHQENWEKFEALRQEVFQGGYGATNKTIDYIIDYIREHPEAQKATLAGNGRLTNHHTFSVTDEETRTFLRNLKDRNGAFTHAIREIYKQEIEKSS